MTETISPLLEHLGACKRLPSPERCRAIRERAGITQALLAEELGVTRQAVSAWEAGRAAPHNSKHLAAYLKALDLMEEYA